MDITANPDEEYPLPQKPSTHSVDLHISDAPNEYTFNSRYGKYKNVPYFEEAKKAYLHKTLNRKHVVGVNTWHEQLIAGRVTPEDIKVIGYSNLARFSTMTSMILIQMTREYDPVSARTIRVAMDAAKKSIPHNADNESSVPTQFRFTLDIATKLGDKVASTITHHESIIACALRGIAPLIKNDLEKAKRLAIYIDEFLYELKTLIPSGGSIDTYLDDDYILLMDNGITPKEASVSLMQGLSAERAVEAHGVSRAVAEGVL